MCRTGGRRCPGQDTPEGRAARNARRRAQYAARKGNKAGNAAETPPSITNPVSDGPTPNIIDSMIQESLAKMGKTMPNPAENSSTVHNIPNIAETGGISELSKREKTASETLHEKVVEQEKTSTSKEGDNSSDSNPHRLATHSRSSYNLPEEVGLNQLDHVMTGTIDYDKLDDESYQYFGFGSVLSSPYKADYGKTFAESEKELEAAKLTKAELGMVKGYTDSDYRRLNGYLFRPETIVPSPANIENIELEDARTKEEILAHMEAAADSPYLSALRADVGFTKPALDAGVEQLDQVIARGPKVQRRVYRGINGNETGIGYISNREEAEKALSNWLDENRSVGSVIQFNGYQSSSLDPKTAMNFASSGSTEPIVYEIVTPEGIAVESTTRNTGEFEVILPRQARYAVVGLHRHVTMNPNSDWSPKATLIQLVAVNSNNEILDGTNSDPLTDPFPEIPSSEKTK